MLLLLRELPPRRGFLGSYLNILNMTIVQASQLEFNPDCTEVYSIDL